MEYQRRALEEVYSPRSARIVSKTSLREGSFPFSVLPICKAKSVHLQLYVMGAGLPRQEVVAQVALAEGHRTHPAAGIYDIHTNSMKGPGCSFDSETG